MPNRDVTVQLHRRERQGNRQAQDAAATTTARSAAASPRRATDSWAGCHLQSASGSGAAWFNVEEYKRPKFKVEVEAPKEAFKLNDTVKVPGKAMQYNGVPVGAGEGRVSRHPRGPLPRLVLRVLLVAAGPAASRPRKSPAASSPTEPDGSFTIPFQAKPDLTVNPKDEPAFRYTITADVTDTTGETRTGTQERAGRLRRALRRP